MVVSVNASVILQLFVTDYRVMCYKDCPNGTDECCKSEKDQEFKKNRLDLNKKTTHTKEQK